MSAFFVATEEKPTSPLTGQQTYSVEERKLMSDILYEEKCSKHSSTTFDRDERRLMAEIAREQDLEEKAKQRKMYEEKREQMKLKREEMEFEKMTKAMMKLRRVESTTKPDLVPEVVKKYDSKRADVLDRLKSKEVLNKMKLQKSMEREKPGKVSEVSKKYDEKRMEVLNRLQKKQAEVKEKYEEKINKPLPTKSENIPEIAKTYENRRAEVLDRIRRTEEEKISKLERKLARVQSINKNNKELIRENSIMDGSTHKNSAVEESVLDMDLEIENEAELSDDNVEDSLHLNEVNDFVLEQIIGEQTKRPFSRYNSFDKRSVLPRIECS